METNSLVLITREQTNRAFGEVKNGIGGIK